MGSQDHLEEPERPKEPSMRDEAEEDEPVEQGISQEQLKKAGLMGRWQKWNGTRGGEKWSQR